MNYRLTAPYLFVLGVVQVSMKYLATYSIFDPPTNDHITCPDYWWRNMLYINTLFPVEQMVSKYTRDRDYNMIFIGFLYSSACYGVGTWLMILNSI